ncbi:hypothetical protein DOK78_003021 [Enterococcus sp. DIV2402]|uniref:DUF3324 domain-containing protein n=1 Tax=Candidatus Enterococcus lowellii TaxID=2230877 RepID=A0ABZ2SWN3_9ENTE|nr:DUF916 and DUF3324 domain-containing protein [Enterococcus sp. DIV2402]MBO0465316.1 DUF916 and DUF3324 domain-containing protein [Enterococcus sp. DIV2402]
MKRIVNCLLCIGAVILFYSYAVPVEAASLGSFEANIKVPDSQTNKELMYYDLLLQPKQTEELSLELKNTSEKELTLAVSFHRAVNNSNGAIVYSDSSEGKSDSAAFDIEDLVAVSDKEVTLKPNETKQITIEVAMPNEEFAGVLAGGLYIQQVGSEEFEGNVQNLFAREIALIVRNRLETVEPEIKINSAKALQENARNAVSVVIENSTPTYIGDVELSYAISRDEQTIIEETKMITFAPNTKMNYFIPLSGQAFEAGTYTVKTTLTAGDNVWQGAPTFTIEADEAKEYNQTDVSIEKTPLSWLTIGIGVAVGLLFIFVIILVIKNKKLQKELKSTKK